MNSRFIIALSFIHSAVPTQTPSVMSSLRSYFRLTWVAPTLSVIVLLIFFLLFSLRVFRRLRLLCLLRLLCGLLRCLCGLPRGLLRCSHTLRLRDLRQQLPLFLLFLTTFLLLAGMFRLVALLLRLELA